MWVRRNGYESGNTRYSFPSGYIYTRSGNPNRTALEECLTALEGGAACAAFGSGLAAAMAVFQALAPGDHVIVPDDAYHGVSRLVREIMAPWGLQASVVDMTNLDAVRAALRPNTRLVWVETPSNPLLKISDIAALAAIAHEAGARCVVDNTWATPVLQQPLLLGADLALHATTKYLGGHSDVLGGAIVARESDAFFERVRFIQGNGGAVPSPFDCWLILRGIRSLAYRMRGHAENAARVADFGRPRALVHTRHQPGRRGKPDRAPRLGGRAGKPHPARPAAYLGWPGTPR